MGNKCAVSIISIVIMVLIVQYHIDTIILSPCVPLCLGGHTNMNGMLAIDRKIAIIKEETICIWLYLIFIDNKTDIQAVLLSVSRVSV